MRVFGLRQKAQREGGRVGGPGGGGDGGRAEDAPDGVPGGGGDWTALLSVVKGPLAAGVAA